MPGEYAPSSQGEDWSIFELKARVPRSLQWTSFARSMSMPAMQSYLGCGANGLQSFMVLQSMICFSRSRMLSITVQPYVGGNCPAPLPRKMAISWTWEVRTLLLHTQSWGSHRVTCSRDTMDFEHRLCLKPGIRHQSPCLNDLEGSRTEREQWGTYRQLC